ncbi:glutamate-5-semialdehyde dehydrogenase [Evansella caseinilytica]|uniref:Gamma-glutamyl phosphate reductase n=1 Tax=Evansella caseinilytica TaxID=1503961 RepID=A0A1H3NVC2_9BACI|nr:glutamate-5-semialdehyde dehydrogenase [Evansella caseinilytica]SDY92784.1 glutamate-5-semialdehyde dehydrogenase [Evansella caseinilytica]
MGELLRKAALAKAAAVELAGKSTEAKNEALRLIANQLQAEKNFILTENRKDIDKGKEAGISSALLDRLALSEARIDDISQSLELLVELADPVGETLSTIERPNGLSIQKVRVPLGVVGMIYEARPNVTVDAAGLSLKTGNAVLLRGSSSALFSNKAVTAVIQRALEQSGLPKNAVQLLEDTSRETAEQMFRLNEYLDVLIPRGGASLIQAVVEKATVPVLETGVGNCHIYIDDSAQAEMAVDIVINAKTQRPSVCNAAETVLVHRHWAEKHFPSLAEALAAKNVAVKGDERAAQMDRRIAKAEETDWKTEYLDLTLALKIVDSVDEAIEHIRQYGTKHSEAIITETPENVEVFFAYVDAAALYHNASTRFTDGFEFGFGAEIGISTQKLHARGPMGLEALTTVKYLIHGSGQTRC